MKKTFIALLGLGLGWGAGRTVYAATPPVLTTGFQTERFVDEHRMDLPVRNWFEFAARHREDGGQGAGTLHRLGYL